MMSDMVVKNVQNMLNEEKWTRATLSNYSINQFKELDNTLKQATESNNTEIIRQICNEHLSHTKNSIIGLYLSGMISLSYQIIDDSALVNLITIFIDNHKWNIVQYLSERMLDFGESKYALRMLADCYKNNNEEEKAFEVLERLVKVDFEEADIVKALAEYYEGKADIDNAIEYYKKALHRYVNKKLFTSVKEIWTKLLYYCPEEIDFFLLVQKKVAKNISEEKAASLLQELYSLFHKRGDIDISIDILKLILNYDERDSWARKEIVDCYRMKFSNHSQLEDYIKLSNLTQGWRNVHDAISDFEKHIAFDSGNFVFHRTWGVGRIASVTGNEIEIDFAKKREHVMSLKMAVNALQTLTKNHIWVLKATWKRDKLKEKIKKDPNWALKMIIRSFDNSCDLKKIKSELTPSILTPSEWTSWSAKAREHLKTDPAFGVNPSNVDQYVVRDRPISLEEKIFNEFKAERNFYKKVQTLRDFIKMSEPDSEYFNEMFSYFTAYLKTYSTVNDTIIASYLVVKEIISQFPHLNLTTIGSFSDLFEEADDPIGIYLALKDTDLKKNFLNHIKLFIANWSDTYVKLFPYALTMEIIDQLYAEGFESKLVSMIINCFENYREYKEAVLWSYKNLKETKWYSQTGLSDERQIITLIHILEHTFKEIENHRDTTGNRRINKQVHTVLFKDGVLDTFIDESNPDTITRIYTLIDDVKDLDLSLKLRLRNRILDKNPEFKFFGDEERITINRGLIVTASKYDAKQKELQRMIEEEVPANSKEIGIALSMGDLRENAEYKAAKEKQEILNSMIARMKDEIERAQIFDPTTVNNTRVSFGTKVSLKNETTGQDEIYSILGPWESDPNNFIISYLSPFGNAVLNKKKGDKFDFVINDEKKLYTVLDISVIK